MGEYAAIEKEAKLFTELCVHNDAIDPNLFDEFGVKRGLRDKDGNGVLAGITNISRIDAFEMRDGVKTPCDGKLWYRGYNVYDLIRGLRGKRYGFEEVAYLLLLGDLPNEQQLHEFTDCLTKCRALPSNFVRDVIMKAPSKDLMNSLTRSVLTLAYIAKFLHAAFLGQPSKHLDHVQEAPLTMRVPMAILAIGCIITGVKDGKEKTIYIYNVCDHQECYKELGCQAVAYTTGVPAMIGAKLFLEGVWKKPGVHNVEEFDPDPFMELLNTQGLPWHEEFDKDLEL